MSNVPLQRRRFTLFVRTTPGALFDEPRKAAEEIEAAENFIKSQPGMNTTNIHHNSVLSTFVILLLQISLMKLQKSSLGTKKDTEFCD
jgi:hypothetical protein